MVGGTGIVQDVLDVAVEVSRVEITDVDGLALAAAGPDFDGGFLLPFAGGVVAKGGQVGIGGAVWEGVSDVYGSVERLNLLKGIVKLKDWRPSIRGGGTVLTKAMMPKANA